MIAFIYINTFIAVMGICLALIHIVNASKFLGFLAIASVSIINLILLFLINEPTAMDLHAGKATVQYTIVDDVKIDSCIVWKNIKN